MLKYKIKKKLSIRKIKKLKLTRQIRDVGYETELTTYKANYNKL
jgi:hypothetical protein